MTACRSDFERLETAKMAQYLRGTTISDAVKRSAYDRNVLRDLMVHYREIKDAQKGLFPSEPNE